MLLGKKETKHTSQPVTGSIISDLPLLLPSHLALAAVSVSFQLILHSVILINESLHQQGNEAVASCDQSSHLLKQEGF
jgi:hypothetical protein